MHCLLRLISPTDRGPTTITLPARKTQIAARLAVTPETLSRVLRPLEPSGLIEMQGYRLHISSIVALREPIG